MTPHASALAPYAVADATSRGRVHAEPNIDNAPAFEIDRHRILSCAAFRRLMHKTQVFVTAEGDHFRTRLTHTLEVASQAQRLARLLQLNEQLAGDIALAHDLGHPPFGHAGEMILRELMQDHGGFEHNHQALRVVDYLEHPYPHFRGLNLSFEVRESIIKHHTRYDQPETGEQQDESIRTLLDSGPQASLEGQVANLADAIAYTLHDIEDGLGAGMLSAERLEESAIWRDAAAPIRKGAPDRPIHALRRPILDSIATRLAADVRSTSTELIAKAGVRQVADVRSQPTELVAFSPLMSDALEELQNILSTSVYHNHRVVRMDSKAKRLIRELFDAYVAEPQLLPERFANRIDEQGLQNVICDYIAGMTDRFCQREHRRLYAPFDFD